jgi:hypothetical protein
MRCIHCPTTARLVFAPPPPAVIEPLCITHGSNLPAKWVRALPDIEEPHGWAKLLRDVELE